MDQNIVYGLPKLVDDLLRSKMSEKELNLKFKVVSSGNFTQLTLTWIGPGDSHTNQNRSFNRPNGVHNNNKHYQPGLYRKKTPCEIRRDQRRKQEFRLNLQQKQTSNQSQVKASKSVSTPVICKITDTPSKMSSKQCHIAGKVGVKTRSMTVNDTPECARKDISQSLQCVAPMINSPESVHGQTLDLSTNSCADASIHSSHSDSSTHSSPNSSVRSMKDCESSPICSRPTESSRKLNCHYLQFGGTPREHDANLYKAMCSKCNIIICYNCTTVRKRHEEHGDYIQDLD